MRNKRLKSLGVIIGVCLLLGATLVPAAAASGSGQRTAIVTITVRVLRIRAIVLDEETLEIKMIKSNTTDLYMTAEDERDAIQFEVYIGEIFQGGNIGLPEVIWEKYLELWPEIDWSKKGIVYIRE